MTTLFITEYAELARDAAGQPMQVGQEPSLAVQAVTFTTTAASAAFNAETRYVRLQTTGNCHVVFGTAPTATTSKTPLSSGAPEWFGVPLASSYKVAAVDGSF